MTESERDLITAPATGLLIYQTNNTPGFYYYNSTAWVPFGGADNDWTMHANGNDMYNANTGNVGVGNTAPSTKFHITGTTTVPAAAINNLYSQDFSGSTLGSVTSTVSPNEYQISAGGSEVWEVVDAATDYVSIKCTSCIGQWIEIQYEAVNQNETFVSTQLSPSATATSLDITFDYRYRQLSGGAGESFIATLYNETDNAVASSLVSASATDVNTSYSGTFTFSGTNIATDDYTLRFQYIGNNDYGASVDNIVVDENTIAGAGSYVFRLEDGQQQVGYVLTSDANGNATWEAAASGGGTDSQTLSISGSDLTISNGNTVTLPGGGGSYTFDNGLTLTGSNVQLGGTLVKNTTIDLNNNDLTFDGTSTGEFVIEGNNTTIMQTNVANDYAGFGYASFPSGTLNNTTLTEGGNTYTVDVVAGFQSPISDTSGGSAVKLGSIEHIIDGQAEWYMESSAAFSPFYGAFSFADLGNTASITNYNGTTTGEWEDIYVQNTVTVSDRRSKSNINELKYGLNEIMKLKPVSFDYKKQLQRQKEYNAPRELVKQKLGFIAQDLVGVLPEVVKTHDWKVIDEKSKTVEYKENNMYGVMYSDIVPVTVKAIQEQQVQIEELKSEVSDLKELVNKLISERK